MGNLVQSIQLFAGYGSGSEPPGNLCTWESEWKKGQRAARGGEMVRALVCVAIPKHLVDRTLLTQAPTLIEICCFLCLLDLADWPKVWWPP
jgi:hypothetical protein